MKIFVSHAISDKILIDSFKKSLERHGITLLVAEHFVDVKNTITAKIEKLIQSCDLAMFLLTQNGYNSNFVQQEIGYVKSLRKPILQVIEIGIEKKLSGFTFGHDYIPYSPDNSTETISKVEIVLIKHLKLLEKRRKREENIKFHKQLEIERIAREKAENEKKIGLGILAGVLILGLLSSK